MKRAAILLVIAGALTLASCSGSSPSPPAMPTPTTQTWAITALVVSDASPYVGDPVTVTATVTRDGAPAPDGTLVNVRVSDPAVLYDCATGSVASGASTAKLTTSGGQASVCLYTETAGTYSVVAEVHGVTRSVNVAFQDRPVTQDLAVSSVVPSEGSLSGGETIQLYGQGFMEPLEVSFVVEGQEAQGQVLTVTASGDYAQVRTPEITWVPHNTSYPAVLRVRRAVGSTFEQAVELAGAFTFRPGNVDPEIYSVFPAQGSSRGGDQVTIYGRNFAAPVRVTFSTDLGTVEADELAVSADGSQITLTTPPLAATPVEGDHVADVTVYNEAGTPREKAVSKASAFVFLADHPTPVINAMDPLSGPMEGGTRVTIMGSGFEFPVQVMFGTREANVVSVAYDQIVVISPDYTPTGQTPPVTVDVTVRNVSSGLTATSPVGFTYGEAMYITSNSPTEGDAAGGDLVTIYGSGFRAPLTVTWNGGAGSVAQAVVSVSGNQVVIRTSRLDPYPCDDQTGTFVITQVDSGATAEGGSWTYRGQNLRIFGASPASGPTGTAVTITGRNFAAVDTTEPVRVTFDDLAPQLATFPSATDPGTIQTTVPDTTAYQFDSVECTGTGGYSGCRTLPALVDLAVENLETGCSDTLANGFTLEPPTTACKQLVPAVAPNYVDFGDVAVGSSANVVVTLSNNGGVGDLGFDWTANTAEPFTASPASGTLAPGDSVAVTITFTPTIPGPAGGAVTFQVVGGECAAQTAVSVQLNGNGV